MISILIKLKVLLSEKFKHVCYKYHSMIVDHAARPHLKGDKWPGPWRKVTGGVVASHHIFLSSTQHSVTD